MSYDDPKRNASIVAQVSFKAAIDVAVADQVDFGSDEDRAKFENTLGYLHDSLTSHIGSAQNVVAPSVDQAAEKIRGNFPGTTEVNYQQTNYQPPTESGGWTVAVKNEQQGPLPQWLIDQARDAGVSAVWDNRQEASGTKKPLFKAADGTKSPKNPSYDLGFWPK